MAQYHLSAHAVISRANGQKVVRSAAYAAGERLQDDRYGEVHDFTRRRHVLDVAMVVPQNAPDWARDRQQFWNAVEHKEKRKDSQLAIPYDIALPYELTLEQNIALIREYAKTAFADRGLVADVAIHRPDPRRDPRNIHAHILIPTRPIDDDGLGPKIRKAGTKQSWEQEREENILRLRESWAEHHNRHMAAAGFDSSHYIDHQSLEDQGIAREPTTHRGVAADHMEQRGVTTDRGDDYRNIQAQNEKRALRKRKRKDYADASEASPMPDAQSEAEKIAAEAIRKEEERQEQARKDQDKLQEALIAEDKLLKELGQIYRDAQAHRDRLVQQAQELALAHDRIEQEQERQAQKRNPVEDYAREVDQAVEGRRQDIIEKRDLRYLEGDIRDAGDRYSQALHHNYDWGDPYQSLAKAAIAEHSSFRTDQALLSAEIAKTADPKAREALEIRRQIEGYEYLMITGDRIAMQSEIISGRLVNGKLVSEESARMRERINGEIVKDENGKQTVFPGYSQEAQNLRFRYRELQAERAAPAKEQAQPQSALDKIVEDAKRHTQEQTTSRNPQRERKQQQTGSAPPDKSQTQRQDALDKIVEDAKNIAEGRQLLDRITEAKRQNKDQPTKTPDPQEKKDLLQQQERERKAQKDRERER